MQRLIISFSLAIGVFFTSCEAQETAKRAYTLEDFYGSSEQLNSDVDRIYAQLAPDQRVAQMIVTSLGKLGKPIAEVKPLIERNQVGGVIFLSGDPAAFKSQIAELQEMSKGLPLLMSMDAEPSLFNRRMPGTPEMPPTNTLQDEAAIKGAVSVIDSTLLDIGFRHNYAPVVDVSPNNEAIGNRTLGSDEEMIVPLAKAFIQATQEDQIIATAKHFPGHGRVSGDTHKKLVYIDGELTEVDLYPPLIDAGVLSIMVAHIAIENNETYGTDGMPSTLSPQVVTKLLRKELGFKGIIITDAMNMGAVAEIPNSTLLAAKAGCDLILMPPNEVETLRAIINEMATDQKFKRQAEASIKRVIRMKLCLGMEFDLKG